MIGTSDQSCWLAEACKILLLLLHERCTVTCKRFSVLLDVMHLVITYEIDFGISLGLPAHRQSTGPAAESPFSLKAGTVCSYTAARPRHQPS